MPAETDFGAAMADMRLRTADISRLTGRDRKTIYRWRKGTTPVPPYVWTILRLQRRVRELSSECARRAREGSAHALLPER